MRMQLCTYQHFVLLCITIFKTDLNTLLILNFSLCELAQLPLQSLLGAAVNIDLFIVCDCDWESFSPLCLITFYCHIKRKRNQNWLVVQLYCLIFHHGQTELSPLIHKNFFFLLPFFPLSIRTFILLVSCLFMAYFICDINFPHPWNIKKYICVVLWASTFIFCLFSFGSHCRVVDDGFLFFSFYVNIQRPMAGLSKRLHFIWHLLLASRFISKLKEKKWGDNFL